MNILKSKPFPQLETDRLLLRLPTTDDTGDYHLILSYPEISQYSDVPHNPSEKRSKRFVSWMSKLHARGTGIGWLIELKKSNTLVGAIRINSIEKKASIGVIGYEIHPEHWRSGIATEALGAVVNHAHGNMSLNRLEAWTAEQNSASEKVLLNNGFTYEGLQRDKIWFKNQHWNVRLFGRLASDELPR